MLEGSPSFGAHREPLGAVDLLGERPAGSLVLVVAAFRMGAILPTREIVIVARS